MIPILLLYFIRLCGCQSPPEVKYLVNLDSQMEACDDVSMTFMNTAGVIVDRYNETISYMFGDVEFLKGMGPNIMVEIILDKEASGKYELMFSHEILDFCDELSKGPDGDYYKYFKYFGIPDTCPIEAGKYPIKEMVIDTKDLPVNSNTCGRYLAYLKLYNLPDKERKNEKEFLCCLFVKLIIEME